MKQKTFNILTLSISILGTSFASVCLADDATDAVGLFAEGFLDDITTILTNALPKIILVTVLIFGTLLVFRLAKKFIK